MIHVLLSDNIVYRQYITKCSRKYLKLREFKSMGGGLWKIVVNY